MKLLDQYGAAALRRAFGIGFQNTAFWNAAMCILRTLKPGWHES
jgi:hypothetical protein